MICMHFKVYLSIHIYPYGDPRQSRIKKKQPFLICLLSRTAFHCPWCYNRRNTFYFYNFLKMNRNLLQKLFCNYKKNQHDIMIEFYLTSLTCYKIHECRQAENRVSTTVAHRMMVEVIHNRLERKNQLCF